MYISMISILILSMIFPARYAYDFVNYDVGALPKGISEFDIIPNRDRDPLIIDDGSVSAKCRRVWGRKPSPSEYEYDDFLKRLSRNGRRVEVAVNVRCVQRVYTRRELEAWRASGDPLAVYALLERNYRVTSAACANRRKIESDLMWASKVKNHRRSAVEPLVRFPELIYVAGLLRMRCKVPGYRELMSTSEDVGFYPKLINDYTY